MEDVLSQSIIDDFSCKSSFRNKQCKPPKEAYLFFPEENDILLWDASFPNKTMRRIFEGAIEYNEFEKAILVEFKEEFVKYTQQTNKVLEFPFGWTEANTLRFIQGSGYNIDKAIENIHHHFKWRKETLPIHVSQKIIEILNLGFIYGHGRDTNFRPIIIINAKIYSKYAEKYSVNEWIQSVVYLIEYTIENLLIPGQIENWNIILDVAEFSMIFIPSQLRIIFYTLMNNYKCRLYVMYIVNVSQMLNILWSTVNRVLDSKTQNKIKLLKKEDLNQIFTFINPFQVEQRFLGKAPNVERHYFPHIIPSENFNLISDPLEKFMSTDKYLELVKRNKNVIKSPYINFEEFTCLESKIILIIASKYEDANSRSCIFRVNPNISPKNNLTVYEDCEENKTISNENEREFNLDKGFLECNVYN